MKSWLDATEACGGGDIPEAVADALHEVHQLSWRTSAVKIAVLISDAPPHGLDPPYNGRREGPFYYDIMWEAIMMARAQLFTPWMWIRYCSILWLFHGVGAHLWWPIYSFQPTSKTHWCNYWWGKRGIVSTTVFFRCPSWNTGKGRADW